MVVTPRVLVCAALPMLLSAHCPACCPYSSLSFHTLGHLGEIQASCPFLPVQVLLYSKVMNRGSMKCCWGVGESKGIWLQCSSGALCLQISVLRDKQAGPVSGCSLCINFSPLWYLVSCSKEKKNRWGARLGPVSALQGGSSGSSYVDSGAGRGFEVWLK